MEEVVGAKAVGAPELTKILQVNYLETKLVIHEFTCL